MAVVLKPNEVEDWLPNQSYEVTVNGKRNDTTIEIPCGVFVFRKDTRNGASDGRLYGVGEINGATREPNGHWRFSMMIHQEPRADLFSHDLDQDVIDPNDGVIVELAEVRRISWTRFFAVSSEVEARLMNEYFGG
ncbi:hypothetical protein [Aliiroseovarius sp.]|uniref:hypothetical protein n=1 Tax=Aliiroseovarius sp. TaxID=1872442 RepID=UPI003BABB9DA